MWIIGTSKTTNWMKNMWRVNLLFHWITNIWDCLIKQWLAIKKHLKWIRIILSWTIIWQTAIKRRTWLMRLLLRTKNVYLLYHKRRRKQLSAIYSGLRKEIFIWICLFVMEYWWVLETNSLPSKKPWIFSMKIVHQFSNCLKIMIKAFFSISTFS